MATLYGVTSIKHNLSTVNPSDSTSALSAGKGKDLDSRLTSIEQKGILVLAHRDSAQTIDNDPETVIFSSETRDSESSYDVGTGIYTVPSDGDYIIEAFVSIGAPTSAYRLAVENTGSVISYGTPILSGVPHCGAYVRYAGPLTAGDEISIVLYGATGSDVTEVGPENIYLRVYRS